MRIRSFNIILVVLLGVLCTLGIVSAAEITPLSVPPGLVATAQSSSPVNLSWAASTDRVAAIGSDIYGGATKIGTLAANSYSDSGLPAATIYSYTVYSYEAAANISGQPAS